uniref:Putative ovule protein n=1 Tax=Solanum chacoense TaxID=4108 RepID=A0A0V0H2V2_SOLCH
MKLKFRGYLEVLCLDMTFTWKKLEVFLETTISLAGISYQTSTFKLKNSLFKVEVELMDQIINIRLFEKFFSNIPNIFYRQKTPVKSSALLNSTSQKSEDMLFYFVDTQYLLAQLLSSMNFLLILE